MLDVRDAQYARSEGCPTSLDHMPDVCLTGTGPNPAKLGSSFQVVQVAHVSRM